VLKAFGAQIFFDDQDLHLATAAKLVPSARVPYRGGVLGGGTGSESEE
jgi:5'-nucleotidase